MIIKRIPDELLTRWDVREATRTGRDPDARKKFYIETGTETTSDGSESVTKFQMNPFELESKEFGPEHAGYMFGKTWNSGKMGFSDDEIKKAFQGDKQIYKGKIPNADSPPNDITNFNNSFMMLAIYIDENEEFTNYIEPFSSNMYDLRANKFPYKNKSGETYNIDTSTVRDCSDKINKDRRFDDYIILAQEKLKNGTKITKDSVFRSHPNDNYYKVFKQDTHDNINFYDTWNPEINNQTWDKVSLNDNNISRQFFCADTKFTSEKDKLYYDNCIKGLYDDYKIDDNGKKTGFCLTQEEWNNDKRKAAYSGEKYKKSDTFKEESWEKWNLKYQKQCPGPKFANRCHDFVHTLNEENNKFKCGDKIDDNKDNYCNAFLEANPGKFILEDDNFFRNKYPTPLCGSSDEIKKKCPQMCCGYGKCPYNNKKDDRLCSNPGYIQYKDNYCPKEKQGKTSSESEKYFRSLCPWLCSSCNDE